MMEDLYEEVNGFERKLSSSLKRNKGKSLFGGYVLRISHSDASFLYIPFAFESQMQDLPLLEGE